MDGQGCWRDNICVERLWRTVKYEEVYLHAYATVAEEKWPVSAATSRSTTRAGVSSHIEHLGGANLLTSA